MTPVLLSSPRRVTTEATGIIVYLILSIDVLARPYKFAIQSSKNASVSITIHFKTAIPNIVFDPHGIDPELHAASSAQHS